MSTLRDFIRSSELITDTTPQLNGDLDANGKNILMDDGTGINDENNLQQIIFSTTASAVNEITIKNAATGSGPEIQATGDDANIDIELVPKGTGGVNLLDSLLKRAIFVDYGEKVKAHGSLSIATNASLEDGNVHTFTVGGSFTLTLIGEPASGIAGSITFIITNGGSATLTWDTAIDWPGGTAPTLTTSGVDVVTCMTLNGGTTWYGFAAGLAMA
jgi:hypothetical protein